MTVFLCVFFFFFFSSRRRHTRSLCDWSSDVCSSDLGVHLTSQLALRTADQTQVMSRLRAAPPDAFGGEPRSEERRVGKECRSRWSAYHEKKKREEEESMGMVNYAAVE